MTEQAKIRTLDDLGRLYIPKEFRHSCGFHEGDDLVVETDGEVITLRRWEPDPGDTP